MKELFIKKNPKGMFSESIKTIRTNISFSSIDKDIKTILVTSPNSSDGKSFISSNLAYSFAIEDKKVLLIDCDLRKGRLAERFELDNKKGYSNLILDYKDKIKLGNYIKKTKYENLDVLTNGVIPPNPLELLNSVNNKKLMEVLKEKYDIVILDCPPTIGLSDALIMTNFSEFNMVVISNKKTTNKELQITLKAFENVNRKVNGVVMNKVAKKNNSYYSSYYSNSKYGE